jgi:hypothetical protein
MNTQEINLVAIKPLVVINVLKKLNVTVSHAYKNSQTGVSSKRRMPRTYTASTGWAATSVDRTGKKAETFMGRVYTAAEAVSLTYRTNGYSNMDARIAEQTPAVIAALTNAGFTVTATSDSVFLITKVGA